MSRTEYWKQFANRYKGAYGESRDSSERVDYYKRLDIDAALLVNSRFAISVDKLLEDYEVNPTQTEIKKIEEMIREINLSIKKNDKKLFYQQIGFILNRYTSVKPDQSTVQNISDKILYYEFDVDIDLIRDIIVYMRYCYIICNDNSLQILKTIHDSITTEKEVATKTLNFDDKYDDIYSNIMKYIGQIYPRASRLFC